MAASRSNTGDADFVRVSEDNKVVLTKSGRGSRGQKPMTKRALYARRKAVQRLGLPRFLAPELKRIAAYFWDAETLDDPGTGASGYAFFGDITQGTTQSSRTGDVIFVHKVVLRLYMEQSTSVNFSTAEIRLFMDMEPAAGGPSWTTAFNGIGGASIQTYHVAYPANDNRFRFRYLREQSVSQAWSAASYNGSGVTNAIKPFSEVWDVPINKEVRYSGSSGRPVAGCELELFAWSSINSNTPKLWASYEIFFTDV